MARRHLFDHGYPVTEGTLLAGSEVLLALSRRSVYLSRERIARSYSRLADSSARLLAALIRRRSTDLELSQSADKAVTTAGAHRRA